MNRISLCAMAALIVGTGLLSGCVGTSTPPDPDRHPDAAKRKEMRHFYDSRYKKLIRKHA